MALFSSVSLLSLLVATSSAFSLAPLRMSADCGASRRRMVEDVVKSGVGSAAILQLSSSPGLAIDRPAAKALFFRYTPRIEAGSRWFSGDLKRSVDSGEWSGVIKYFEQTLDNPKKKERSTTSSTVERDLLRPMSLLAGSFAEKGVSEKKDSLNELTVEFSEAMVKLEGAARGYSGKKSGGFLGLFASEEPDVLKGRSQSAVAKEAYGEAKKAFVKYVDIANDGLDFDLKKIEGPSS